MAVGTKNRKGFTLLEVLLVILILGTLATVGGIVLYSTRDKAKTDTAKIAVKQLASDLDHYNMNVNSYPTTEQGLQALVSKPAFDNEEAGKNWGQLAQPEQLKDPWGNDYKYDLVDNPNVAGQKIPHVWSVGPDAQDGTEDDIKSWTEETK